MKMEMTMPRCFQNKNCVRKKRPCIIYRYIHESWGFRLTNLFFRGRIGLWVIRRWLSNFCFSADLTFKFGSEAEIITTDQSHAHTTPNKALSYKWRRCAKIRCHWWSRSPLRYRKSTNLADFCDSILIFSASFIVPKILQFYFNLMAKICFILVSVINSIHVFTYKENHKT